MGNSCASCVSGVNDTVYTIYDKYYPKQKFLHPIYVTSAGMMAVVGCHVLKGKNVHVDPCHCRNFGFLTAIGAGIGLHTWGQFVDGPSMYQLLPRHQFGLVQRNLAPKYMFLVTWLSFGSLVAFLKHNPWGTWKDQKHALGCLLAAAFALNVVNFTCFSINTCKYGERMHEIEKSAGLGLNTVGKLIQDSKLEENQEYVKTRSKFQRFHCLTIIAGLLSYAATIGQMSLVSKSFSF